MSLNLPNNRWQPVDRLFMIGFEGTRLTPELERFLDNYSPGGFILFSRNIQTVSQLQTLIQDIKRYVSEHGGREPLFAIDQEGGVVNRLRSPMFYHLPGAMAIGRDTTGRLANNAGYYTGQLLAGLGIHIDFAPVVDLNSNPFNPQLGLRSFGDDPVQVGFLGQQFAKGLMDSGVLPVAKHFPGLGDCTIDTHDNLPLIEKNMEELSNRELLPFATLINHGVPIVMTAHVCFPNVEQGVPATVSPSFIQGLLRDQLGFNEVVVTDDLMMGGIVKIMEPSMAALKALQAGVDVCLICNSLTIAAEAMDCARNALDTNQIDTMAIHRSWKRMDHLETLAEMQTSGEIPTHEEGKSLAAEIARSAVTLEGCTEDWTPDDSTKTKWVIYPELTDFCAVAEGQKEETGFESYFSERDDVILYPISIDPTHEECDRIRQTIGQTNVITVSYDAFRHSGQKLLQDSLLDSGIQPIQIITGNPVDEQILPQIPCRIKTYGSHPGLMERAFKLLHLL